MTMMKKSKKKRTFVSPLFCSFVDDRDDVQKTHVISRRTRACVWLRRNITKKTNKYTKNHTTHTLLSLYIRIKMALTIMASLAKVRRLFLLSVVVVVSSSSYSSFMSRFKAHSSPEEEEEEEEMEEEKRLLV